MARARVSAVVTRVATTLAALVAYALTTLAPSRVGLWVFGADGGNRFVGNPKYTFLHVAKERPDEVRAVWVSDDPTVVEMLRERGYEAHHTRSFRGLALTALAEYLFVSHGPADATWWATGGTDVVQCWHGVPVKTVGDHLDRDWSLPGRFFFRLTGSNWAHHVTTGEAVDPVVADAYRQDPDSLLSVGYPRNDVLRDSDDSPHDPLPDIDLGIPDAARDLHDDARTGQVALYVPTWREWSDGLDHGGVPIDDAVDFEALDTALADRDATLYVKLHPRERLDVDLTSLDNVTELPAETDLYPLLPAVDVLVTDYSSIYVDFLHVDRPIVFYPYDRPLYEARPGFEFDYDAVTPGPTPTDFAAFRDALLDALDGTDEHVDARARVRKRFIDHSDGLAAARLSRRLASNEATPTG